MASETTAFKTGMTILRGGNVPAFTLEYLTPGKRKKAGEFETIVIPYALIGRGDGCNIQYGDESPTVSRKHAAIERRGNEFFLVHISRTNPTLLNGQSVQKEVQIKNGDEIQLSMEGPKLRFNATPTGTASMGFTRKISLVTQQAIKPYRTLVFSLIALIIIIAGTGGWFIYKQNADSKIAAEQLLKYKMLREQDSLRLALQQAEFAKKAEATSKEIASIMGSNSKYKETIDKLNDKVEELSNKPVAIQPGPAFYQKFKDGVYFLQVMEILVGLPDGTTYKLNQGWTGTAFLCTDGKLITARHCIQGWRYSNDETSQIINFAELNGGKVFVKFRATSTKDYFDFDYSNVVLDDSKDQVIAQTIESGEGRKKTSMQINFKYVTDSNWGYDWAYFQTDKASNIEIDKELSSKLTPGVPTYVLGFSLGKGGPEEGKVNPIYSESSIGQEGILPSGLVTITSRSFEQGNSGGPVFVQDGDKFKCIGIVSKGEFDATGSFSTIAYIVPIANVTK